MTKLSKNQITLIIALGSILLSIILQSQLLLFGGCLYALVSLICYTKTLANKILARSGRQYYPSFWLLIIVGYIMSLATSIVCTGFITEWDLTVGAVICIIISNLFLSILYTYLYFLPYLIANKHQHIQKRAIYILNIFAGWTILAWFIALIWANTTPKPNMVINQEKPQSNADELRKYKELLDQNIITSEEFEIKKKQLLNI